MSVRPSAPSCPLLTLTMQEAYVELVKVVSAHWGVEQLERWYQRVREVLQIEENVALARKWRANAIIRLI